MADRPQNFFAIWTNAPLVAGATNPTQASLAREFCTWAKDTLAMGLDPEMGPFPPNVYVFDFFSKLANQNGYLKPEYAVGSGDSHPNSAATVLIAPQFVNEIFGAAIAYEGGGSTLAVSPQSRNVSSGTGSTSFAVSSSASWTAQSNAAWCTVTPSGNGNGTITANYTQNTTGSSRTASIIVSASGAGSQTVTVIQAAAASTLGVSPQSQSVGPQQGNINFSITSNTNWTAQSDASWCTVTPSGNGNGTLVAIYTQNTSTNPRTASIAVSASGAATQNVTVVQSGATTTLSISPQSQSVNAPKGNTSFSITSNTNWTAQSDASWCTVTPSGNGNGTLVASYTQNTSSNPRTASIAVSASGAATQNVTVVQSGTAASLSVSPQSQSVNAPQGSTNFSITSNTNWTAQSDASWCTVTPSGNGNGTLVASYTQNTSSNPRAASIAVSANGAATQTVTVVQSGTAATLSVSPQSQSVNAPQGSTNFSITSNTNWTAQSDASWCTVTSSGNGNGTLVANYTQNSSTNPRTAHISVSANGTATQNVTVVQAGEAASLAVSPQYQYVSSAPGSSPFNITSNTNWTASGNSDWCVVTPSGNGNGSLYASYDENTSVSARTTHITIIAEGATSQTVELIQSGTEAKLTVSPPLWNVEAEAGNVTYYVNSNSNWTAQSDRSWCIPTLTGDGNGDLLVGYNANDTYEDRTAIVTVSAVGADDFQVSLIQRGLLTNIQHPDQQKSLKIYPNPSKGLLTIETPDDLKGELRINIINTLGEKIDFEISRANRSTFHIRVNTLSTGIHYISITNGEKVLTEKFILQY